MILRGLVARWPVVKAANQSPQALRDYVARFDNGSTMEAFFGAPEIAGKYYYGDDLKGFNFERRQMRFLDALDPGRDASIHIRTQPRERDWP